MWLKCLVSAVKERSRWESVTLNPIHSSQFPLRAKKLHRGGGLYQQIRWSEHLICTPLLQYNDSEVTRSHSLIEWQEERLGGSGRCDTGTEPHTNASSCLSAMVSIPGLWKINDILDITVPPTDSWYPVEERFPGKNSTSSTLVLLVYSRRFD